jgi:hypothetical protein
MLRLPRQLIWLLTFVLFGCAGQASPPSGFLADYSHLEAQDDGSLRYLGPKMREYNSYILDPIEIREQKSPPVLTPQQSADVAKYFNQSLAKELTRRGYHVVNEPAVGVARVRIAITGVQKSTWWMNLHPASKLSGVGTGGAAMEGEVIDSVTGEQLAAAIQGGKGSQFELDTFSQLDDVKDAIDGWTKRMGERLDQLRKGT